MRQSHIALRNSLLGFVSQGVGIGIGLIMLPFIVSRIGRHAYGIFLLAMSIVNTLEVLRPPVARTCTVTAARGYELGDDESVNRTIGAATIFCLVPAIIGFLVPVVASGWLCRFFEVDPLLRDEAVLVLLLAGVSVLVTFPLFPMQGVLWGLQRYDITYLVVSGFQVLRALVIVAVFVWFRASVVVVMAVTMVSTLATQVVVAVWARRLRPGFRLRLRGLRKADFLGLATFGGLILFTQLLTILDQEASKWIAGGLINVGALTDLWVATMLVQLAYRVVQQVTMVLVPIASRYQAMKDVGMLQELYLRGSRYSFMMAAGILAAATPMMAAFLRIWMGSNDFTWLAPYAVVLGAVTAVTSSSSCSYQVLQGMGDARGPFVAMLVAVAGGLGTMVVATGLFDAGLAGIVAGLCVGQVVRWIVVTWMAVRRTQTRCAALAYQAYLQPLMATVPALGTVLLLQWYWPPEGWWGLILILVAGSVVYALATLPLFTPWEWGLIRSVLDRVRRVFKRPGASPGPKGGADGDDPGGR